MGAETTSGVVIAVTVAVSAPSVWEEGETWEPGLALLVRAGEDVNGGVEVLLLVPSAPLFSFP
jgi:hypothetical protein